MGGMHATFVMFHNHDLVDKSWEDSSQEEFFHYSSY